MLTAEVPSQRTKYYDVLEDLADYMYEGIATAEGMVTTTPGVGSGYLATYKDSDGEWLDGGQTYTLHVPPNPPIKQFWSVTLYDRKTRSFVENDQKNAEVGSRTKGLVQNKDGSVYLYFGPKAPKGMEANWVQTRPGNGWFPIFRFYAPTEGYLERTWALPNIEKVK